MNKGINLPSTQFLVPENKVKCNKFLFLLFNKKPGKMSDEVSHPLWAPGRPPFQDYREFSDITPKLYLRYKMKSKKDKMVSTKMGTCISSCK